MILPTMQKYVDACFRLNGFSGEPPEVVFGDEVNLATQRAERDRILIQSGMVGGFSEDYIMDNYGFRPGEVTPYTGPAPRTELIEVGSGENPPGGAGRPMKLAASLNSSELALEGLALWSGLRAGSPIAAGRVRAAIRESQTPYELVDRLSNLQDDLRPKFGSEMLDAAETALAKGRLDVGRR